MSKLEEYNKLVYPELDGACAVCGIDPANIKQLFQELIDEVIESFWHYPRTCSECGISWYSTHCVHENFTIQCPKGHSNIPNKLIDCDCEFIEDNDFIRQIAKELLEEL